MGRFLPMTAPGNASRINSHRTPRALSAGRSFAVILFACLSLMTAGADVPALAQGLQTQTGETPARSETAATRLRPVVVIDVKGAIGVGSHYHILQGFKHAQRQKANLIVLRMDTPGGLVTATREIISAILASPVPIAAYVAPSGARAASAGTYLSYAAHVAAMAPGTHLGAATPVQMGAPGVPGAPKKPGEDKQPDQKTAGMQDKIVNDAVAYLRSLAELRGRNADWAEKAVREAATLTAARAAELKVVDFTAASMADLLQKAHGRKVGVAGGDVTISSAGGQVSTYEAGWKAKFISAVTNPNVAFILMLIGIYGIIFEFWNPGLTGSGIVGAVCLLIGFAALSVLPLNYAGLALLLLGLALMAAEAFAPGFGILGIGGLVAFVFGAIFLFDPEGADFELRLAWPVIVSAAITSGLLLAVVLGMAIRAARRRIATGAEEFAGSIGKVIDWTGDTGRIRYHGEVWAARSAAALKPGDPVRIAARDRLTLIVEPESAQEA